MREIVVVEYEPAGLFGAYERGRYWDEMFQGAGEVRPECVGLLSALRRWDGPEFERWVARANATFQQLRITFTVYGDSRGTERLIPFDPIPRVIAASEWAIVERGIDQRLRALNRFLYDVYHERHVIRDGVIPASLVLSGPGYPRQMVGIDVPQNIYTHIAGIDLVRDADDRLSSSRPRDCSGCRRATSAAISTTAAARARSWRRTPGRRRFCRRRVGWAWTSPTAAWRTSATCGWRSAATTPTYRR